MNILKYPPGLKPQKIVILWIIALTEIPSRTTQTTEHERRGDVDQKPFRFRMWIRKSFRPAGILGCGRSLEEDILSVTSESSGFKVRIPM